MLDSLFALKSPVLRKESHKETVNTFVSPLFNSYGLNNATCFTGGLLLERKERYTCCHYLV